MRSVVTTREELDDFVMAATLDLGDPAAAVCLLFAEWYDGPEADSSLAACWDPDARKIDLQVVDFPAARVLSLDVRADEPLIEDGVLKAFHARKISRGVWALSPSLHIPGELHAFVVIHGVSNPAPWESLIVLATSF